jgi:iron complex outermembrane receptor protein
MKYLIWVKGRRVSRLSRALQVTGSSIALIAATSFTSTAVAAQTADSPTEAPQQADPLAGDGQPASPADSEPSEESVIVVTGTSIRGVAPVGSNLVSVGREAIEDTSAQTIQQILKTVPSITAAGNAGQGPAGTSYYSPTIHGLGSSASNSTLVLIDGHRFSLGGSPHPLSDPNIIPPVALERVEVIADGASSIYGSDAVAGVINFITRRNYDGFEVSAQAGFGDEYSTRNASLLWGDRWDAGFVMLAYGYSYRSALAYADRDFLQPDHRDEGGTNFQSFNCDPATIQPGGTGPIYLSPTATSTAINSSANAPCDGTRYADVLPREVRHNVMAKIEQDVGDNLTVGVDLVYSNRKNHQRGSRGNLTATAFRTGPQANPFYVNPPGVSPTLSNGDPNPSYDQQTVRWNGDALLGPGAYDDSGSVNYYIMGDLEYRLGENFRITALGLVGRDDSYTQSDGQLCGSCANLGLNGTTNTAGDPTRASIPGTDIFVLNLPLTTSNALDVWSPAGSNRTSPELLRQLTDSLNTSRYFHSIEQARIGLDGTLFELPGGEVRTAIGGEYLSYGLEVERNRSNQTGPASRGSETLKLDLGRHVKSAFAEVLVPLVGSDNELPLVRSFDVNLSVRHDDYSDVGATTNPKIAANWEVARGLTLRGNWSKSFVAPAISSIGDASRNGLASFSGYGLMNDTVIIPISSYPLAAQLPGCNAPGQVTCTIGTSTVQGISFNNGNPDLKPQTGQGWSIGADLEPAALPGFRAGVTLFNAKFRGGVTSPNLATVINTPGLNHLLTIYPNGATSEEVAAVVGEAPLNSPLPPTIYFIRNGRQQNVVNLDIQGLDMDASYQLDTDAGSFRIGGSLSHFLKFDQNIGGGPTFSVLNTTGFNETFPSIQTTGRFNVGWDHEGFSADVFANWIGSYYNWSSSSVTPLERDENGNPKGGGDKVDGNVLFDLNLAYAMPREGILGGSQLFLDVTNLLDTDPPFYNRSNGYDTYGANPIGRVVTIGFRARL